MESIINFLTVNVCSLLTLALISHQHTVYRGIEVYFWLTQAGVSQKRKSKLVL